MAGLVSQLSAEARAGESAPHAATLSGGGSTLSGVALD